jgi:hypothetical protein
MIFEFVLDAISDLLGIAQQDRDLKKSAERMRRMGNVLAAARVREGAQDSQSAGWRPAEMTIAPGVLSADDLVLQVTAVAAPKDDFGLRKTIANPIPHPVVLELTCAGAVWELTVMEEDAARVIAALGFTQA